VSGKSGDAQVDPYLPEANGSILTVNSRSRHRRRALIEPSQDPS
jgi:hypothetical protein